MLVQYQKNNLKKLETAVKNNNELMVVGSENSGRKFVIKEWGNSLPQTIIIELKRTSLNSPYSSLISAIKESKYSPKKKLQITPTFSLSGVLGSLNISLEAEVLFGKEEQVLKYLSKVIKHYSLVFVIDKSLTISDGSIEIIKKFKTRCKGKNEIYTIYVSNDSETNIKCVYFDDISSFDVSPQELLKEFNLDPRISLSDKVINFILCNINSNIDLLIHIVENFNSKSLDCYLNSYDNNQIIDKLLDNANCKYEYKKQLDDLLTICAISEQYFQPIDFAYLLEEHETVIKLLLEYAQSHYLMENKDDSFYILFGIIKKIYASLDELSKRKIYIRIVDMFMNIHPSQYYSQYIFSKLAEITGYSKYLVQYLFSEIRLNHVVDFRKYKEELSEKEIVLVKTYNKAVGCNNSKEYDKCIEELNSIRELNSELLYEINIMKSQSLIKKIDETSRMQAILLLEYDDKLKDENLKFRLNIRKIAALVHIGEYYQALNSCQHTIGYLLGKLEETRAIEYEYYLNVIYRKFSFVSDYDTSINEVEMSVNFFRKHQHDYHKGYYIALNNLFSLYIINMQLSKATKIKKELEELLLLKNSVNFPRREILKNNFILFDFFKGIKKTKEVCAEFRKLYKETKGYADHVLVASNYSIFLMFNNQLLDAEKILVNMIPNTSEDLEGIYDTRVKINLAICMFLINNANRKTCINMLDSVRYNKQAPYYKIRENELNNIKILMHNIEQCNDANEWCKAFKSNIDTPFSSHTTYQQGFVYTTLFNWDDD